MSTSCSTTAFRFDRFLLKAEERSLSVDGASVALSARGFDVLLFLVEHRHRVVGKDEILSAVWKGVIVEENNLAVQVSAIRRALGEQQSGRPFIATIPGRGYRFVSPLDEQPVPLPPARPDTTSALLAPPPRRMPRLAIAVAIAGATLAGLLFGMRDEPPRLSIVVLPFRNLGSDASEAYLADAITDDLTTDLSHLPSSLVIARQSADTFRQHPMGARSIGRSLNVRYLLEGSLHSEGDIVHVNAQLIDALTATHLWASQFDIAQSRFADVRSDIVRRLSSVLDFTLIEIEASRSLHDRPSRPDALDLYLRARSGLDRDDSFEGLLRAQHQLEQAAVLAPGAEDVLAQLALVLLRKIGNFDDPDEWQDHARAATAIASAIALKPQNPLAITARGMLAWEDYRCSQALPDFRMALSLDPDAIEAREGLAQCARDLGRIQDMIDGLKDIMRIDPAEPSNAQRQNLIGYGYLLLDRPYEAVDWLARAHSAIGGAPSAETTLGWHEWNSLNLIATAMRTKHPAEAARLYRDYRDRWPRRTVWQLTSYDSRAYATLPGYASYLAALRSVGIPASLDEEEDFGVPPTSKAQSGDDFAPTPKDIPGARRTDTSTLHALLGAPLPPALLDVGRGTALIPGATLVWPQGVWGNSDGMLLKAARSLGGGAGETALDRTIVVMGDGPLGWSSYNAALVLVAEGFRHILWYRGGEMSWVAHGYSAIDSRAQ